MSGSSSQAGSATPGILPSPRVASSAAFSPNVTFEGGGSAGGGVSGNSSTAGGGPAAPRSITGSLRSFFLPRSRAASASSGGGQSSSYASPTGSSSLIGGSFSATGCEGGEVDATMASARTVSSSVGRGAPPLAPSASGAAIAKNNSFLSAGAVSPTMMGVLVSGQ